MIEGEAIVLDKDHGRVHHLNEVATFILGLCTGSTPEREICAAVMERYDVDEAVARSDTAALLAEMRALELLV